MNLLKTIKEYTEVIVNGIQNGDKIVESLVTGAKVRNKTISTELLAEILKRKEICKGCPFNSLNALKDGVYKTTLDFQHCILCKCRIGYEDSKEFCGSCECGAAAFNKMNPHLPPIEVKWTAFNSKENDKD
jgi:hypothetical protein